MDFNSIPPPQSGHNVLTQELYSETYPQRAQLQSNDYEQSRIEENNQTSLLTNNSGNGFSSTAPWQKQQSQYVNDRGSPSSDSSPQSPSTTPSSPIDIEQQISPASSHEPPTTTHATRGFCCIIYQSFIIKKK